MTKVFVLGIDGGTLDLIEPWVRQGKLPNFRNMMQTGTYGTCMSTVHPLTPQAWASFLTGKNPGKHGLFDFGTRVRDSYALRLTTSHDRKTPTIWNYINNLKMQAGIINVPLTFPPEPLDGFMISGMHTPALKKGVYPTELYEEINSNFPEYEIDVMPQWFNSYDIFLENVTRMTKTRMQTAEYLYLKYKPEFFTVVLVNVDRVQHALWGQMAHPLNGEIKSGWKYSHAVFQAYRLADEYLGRILDFLDNDTVLIVMSDHGFGTLEKDVYLNRFLIQNGFMAVKDKKWEKPFDMANPFLNIDWHRTKAYSYGLFGNIFVNLKGREPHGIVTKGKAYEDTIQSLKDGLSKLKDPGDDRRIVNKIFRREELYHGPYIENAPDLLLIMRNYKYITRGGYEFSGNSLFSKPKINHSGNHRMNGIAFFHGPNIKKGTRIADIQIIDLCPTILSIMDVPIPDDVDGEVVAEIFTKPIHHAVEH